MANPKSPSNLLHDVEKKTLRYNKSLIFFIVAAITAVLAIIIFGAMLLNKANKQLETQNNVSEQQQEAFKTLEKNVNIGNKKERRYILCLIEVIITHDPNVEIVARDFDRCEIEASQDRDQSSNEPPPLATNNPENSALQPSGNTEVFNPQGSVAQPSGQQVVMSPPTSSQTPSVPSPGSPGAPPTTPPVVQPPIASVPGILEINLDAGICLLNRQLCLNL